MIEEEADLLSWLGMTKRGKTGRPFFGDVSKRAVTLVLLSSLMLMSGVKSLLVYLIPTAYVEDAIVAVLPGIVGFRGFGLYPRPRASAPRSSEVS